MRDLITVQNVRGYIDEQGTAWLNAEDVARGLGFTETAASGNVTIRWRTVREYLKSFDYQPVAGSCDDIKGEDYLPENIFYRLAMKAKNAVAEAFQVKVADEILPTIRKTGRYEITSKPYTPATDAVIDVRKVADEIQALFIGVKRGIAISKAIDIAEKTHNIPLQGLKELLPPAEHDTGYLNPTQIGQKLGGLPPQAINRLLADYSFQYKDGKNWRLTDEGKVYGEEIPYTRNGHNGYQIRWSEKVIEHLLKESN